MEINQSIFKAYDIRGVYPEQINAEVVYKIAVAYCEFIKPKKVVVGTDMRLCGDEFKQALIKGFTDCGVNVIDIGLVSTDMFYFAVYNLSADGGIQATASHNPKNYGGLKMVREKAMPISGDSGIYQIRDLAISNFQFPISKTVGQVSKKDITDEYFVHVLKHFDLAKIKPLKVVANANFGMANIAIEYLKNKLPINFVKVIYEGLDGNFPLPLGRPDPLVPENRGEVISFIKSEKPDLGVAWDADADRCFFFDELGQFVTPAYINAILSEYYLKKQPGGKILHDTRVVRVIDSVVEQNGGVSIMTKAGHSFIKERMIQEQAVFGSETSGHYYFADNFYLDNGLFPFLAVLEIISQSGKTFSEFLKPFREKFYISEEINFKFENTNILEDIKIQFSDAQIDNIDGYDFNYPNWRFNIRKSNTENLLRINLEADSKPLLQEKTTELTDLIERIK
jgi:phosphomannomutase